MTFCVYRFVSNEICPLLVTDSFDIAHRYAFRRGLAKNYPIGVISDEAAEYFSRCYKESPMERRYIMTDDGIIRVVHREKPVMYLCIRSLLNKKIICETFFDDSIIEITIIPDDELGLYGFSPVSDQKILDWIKDDMVCLHPMKRVVKYELMGQPVLELTYIPRSPVQEMDEGWILRTDACIYNGEEVEEIISTSGVPI